MTCYLIRHGQDDQSVRGGWSTSPLTAQGVSQVCALANRLKSGPALKLDRIYTSDLPRAAQTAEILASALDLPTEAMPAFRETNNGVLAGMQNELAAQRYPGLYWSSLGWDEQYPGGESPHEFFDRICRSWWDFKDRVRKGNADVLLVTHGGVIQVILCLENGKTYSNKQPLYRIGNAEIVAIEL